ncbi:MAG: hypothetical protein AAB840_02805, partial [Patescibacteria group bacterium]
MISSWSTKTKEELSKALNVNLKSGLSDKEALDRLILTGGRASTNVKPNISLLALSLYFQSFKFFSLAILIILVLYFNMIILGVLALVALFCDAFFWYRRLSISLMLSPKGIQNNGPIVALRSGQQKEVPSYTLVPGDVVFLKEGDKARCAMRVVMSDDFLVSASAYSAFSQPIFKNEEVLQGGLSDGELSNIVFPDSFVLSGGATLVVVGESGYSIERNIKDVFVSIQNIAKDIVRDGGKNFQKFFAVLPLFFFIIAYFFGWSALDSFLVFLASIFLFSWRLYTANFLKIFNKVINEIEKYSVILKNPSILSKMSQVGFVILDKTGVFVEEELKLSKIYTLDSVLNGAFDADKNREVLDMAVLSSETFLSNGVGNYGSPIDRAIIAGGLRAGVSPSALIRRGFKRLDFLPFSRERWFSATLHDTPSFPNRVYFSGEPLKILSKCQFIWRGSETPKKTTLWEEKILQTLKEKTGEGFKVVALSYKDVSWKSIPKSGEVMDDSVFVGFLCFAVKTKEGVSSLVEKTRALRVKPVLVSGDYPEGVSLFAKSVGIIKIGQILL